MFLYTFATEIWNLQKYYLFQSGFSKFIDFIFIIDLLCFLEYNSNNKITR